MTGFGILEPVIDPANKVSFLLDWELTLKCNLDCSYCPVGIHGGHDNSTKHPALSDCVQSIEFMFRYVDLYMTHRPNGLKWVMLNVYGGESLHHPDIVEILSKVREHYKPYQDRWHLTVTTTTNAIVSEKTLNKILPLIDEFTVSYHTNNTIKQKTQFKENIKIIQKYGRRLKCVILMHAKPDLFDDACQMISWCQENNVKYLPRQLDHNPNKKEFHYLPEQKVFFDRLYSSRTHQTELDLKKEILDPDSVLTSVGRACCGGRQTCKDANYTNRHFFVENKFTGWSCSVNHFFLYVKQVNGEIYTNKDCKMTFDGTIAPIGHLNQSDQLLSWTEQHLNNNTLPVIQCGKEQCYCGLCAPKAQTLDQFKEIFKKYHKEII